MSDDIDAVNKKLIHQILKLRQAKAEMQATFDNLDELLLDTSNLSDRSFASVDSSSSHSRTRFHKAKNHRLKINLSDTPLSTSDEDYTIKITDSQRYELTSDDDSSSDTTTVSFSRPRSRSSEKNRKKSKTPPSRSSAGIKFTYKVPISNLPPRPTNFQSEPYYHPYNRNSDFTDESSSDRMDGRGRKKRNQPKPFVPRPAWVPNGKIQPPYKPTLSSSMSSLSDYRESQKIESNPKFAVPWKHTGKIKATSGIYMSSEDLTRSMDRGMQNFRRVLSCKTII